MNTELECPACGAAMRKQHAAGMEVDVCTACGALWLDRGEFDAVVARRFAGMDVEDLLALADFPGFDLRSCPRDGTEMRSVFFQDLELDRCPACAGIFLDAGDRANLRRQQIHASVAKTIPEASTAAPREHPRIDEEIELELDRPKQQIPDTVVQCASCACEVSARFCLRRLDAYWCEECVLEGNYPGSHGPPTQRRIADAARTMAAANARLTASREARDLRSKNSDRITYRRGQAIHGAWTFEEYALLFERMGNAAREIITKFKRKP